MSSGAPVQTGDEFHAVRTCDPYRPIYYGAASGDFNPIHIDDAAAKAAGLPGAILQGLCTMSWASEACVAFFRDPARLRRLRVRFSKPVRLGDTVTVKGRVASVEGGVARVDFTATNERGEDVLKGGVCEADLDGAPPSLPPYAPAPGARAWGTTTYAVGAEKIREFALAIHDAIPSLAYPHPPPPGMPAPYWTAPADRLLAPPTFAVAFAIRPFIAMMFDPAIGADRTRLVHGEQDFHFLEPVRAGDVMTTTGHLAESFSKGGLEFLVVESSTRNQHGREAVRATWTAVVRK